MKIKEIVYFVFFIFIISAILKVKKAPLILFYTYTIERLPKLKSKKILVDEKAMLFAHTLGATFSGILSLLLFFKIYYAWGGVFIFAILKTVSALGFCPATKLYECLGKGSCCTFIKK